MNNGSLQRTVNCIVDVVGHQHRADWNQPAAKGFRENQHIGLNTIMLKRKPRARARQTRLHLIEY